LLKDLDPLALVPDAIQVQGIVAASASLKATLSLDGLRSAVPGMSGACSAGASGGAGS
jgi:hypothetical protein